MDKERVNHDGHRVRRVLLSVAAACLLFGLSGTALLAQPDFQDQFTGSDPGMPPGWSFCSPSAYEGDSVNDAPPNQVRLSADTCIMSDSTFDPSGGGHMAVHVGHSGETNGREIQYSLYLLGEDGVLLHYWLNAHHDSGKSHISLDEGTRTTGVMFNTEGPVPNNHVDKLYWDSEGVRFTRSDPPDYDTVDYEVSYTWEELGGTPDLNTQARIAIQGRPSTVQRFETVKVFLD